MIEFFTYISNNWVELTGYAAAVLVFVTFCMKTLVPLRIMAIASNVVFIVYAMGAGLLPVLLLHAALLPLNILRTWEQIRIYQQLKRSASGDISAEVETLRPFMRRRHMRQNEVLFRKGETATAFYYITSGAVLIPEIGKTLEAGTVFGEMGLFTPDRTRTASAQCAQDCEMLVISHDDILRRCTSDPAFGLFLTRLIAARMTENTANVR